jgi:hypothetical protein
MRLRLSSCLFVLALTAASAGASSQELPTGVACADIPGTAQVMGAGRIVMVGEVHGTNEMPAEFLRLVCSALRRGQAVSVGLEMFDPDGALQAYMASSGDAAARQALLAGRHWNGMRDGRSSLAWLGMIESLRRMRASGLSMNVFVLNDLSFKGSYDQVMAARLRQEHAAHPEALILSYTGNVHSMLKAVAPFPATIGSLLADLEPVSIVLGSEAGQSWFCRGAGECGPGDWPAPPEHGPLHTARPSPRTGVYTLQLNVGRITASPPAVPVPASR